MECKLDYNPVYSPDGRYLVFTSERSGTAHLYVIDTQISGSDPKRLTTSHHFEDQATFTPDGQYIVYVSVSDNLANIHKMPFKPGTVVALSEVTQLTHNQWGNFHPAVSHDGKHIAFSSNRNFEFPPVSSPIPHENYMSTDLYVMDIDGANARQLFHDEAWEGSPTWSPDDKQIFFYSTKNGHPGIFSTNADGSNLKEITTKALPAISPTIKPDGRLAFSAQVDGKWTIVSTQLDGSDLKYESDTRVNYHAPQFNPISSALVCYGVGPTTEQDFLNEKPGAIIEGEKYTHKPLAIGPFFVNKTHQSFEDINLEIYNVRGYFPLFHETVDDVLSVQEFTKIVKCDPYGKGMQALFQVPNGVAIGLSWSPDRKHIALATGMPFSPPETKIDIYTVDLDERTVVNITEHLPGSHVFPRFAPNGKQIIFRGGHEGHKNLFSIHLDGSNLKRLTFTKGIDTMPDISQDGLKVVFSSVREGQNYNIYLLNLDENGDPQETIQLTDSKSANVHPTFSPDGKWIAFGSSRSGILDEIPIIGVFSPQPYGEIYAMRIEDRKLFRLTETKWEAGLPNWK